MNKALAGAAAALLAVSLLAACDSTAGEQLHLGEKIRIGANVEATGGLASLGDPASKGIHLAVQQINDAGGINGQEIDLTALDNRSDWGRASALTTQLMTQGKVLAVIGPTTTPLFATTASISNHQHIVSVAGSACGSEILQPTEETAGSYTFRTCISDDQQGATLARLAFEQLNAQRAAVLQLADVQYTEDFAKGFRDRFAELGGQVAVSQPFPGGAPDTAGIVSAVTANRADVIFIAGPPTEGAMIIRALREAGLNVPVLGTDGFDSPVLAQSVPPELLSGVYYTVHYTALDTANPKLAEFVEGYRAAYSGEEPPPAAALAYDATLLVADAIAWAEQPTGVAVRDALAATTNLQGATGLLAIDEFHQSTSRSR